MVFGSRETRAPLLAVPLPVLGSWPMNKVHLQFHFLIYTETTQIVVMRIKLGNTYIKAPGFMLDSVRFVKISSSFFFTALSQLTLQVDLAQLTWFWSNETHDK